MNSDRDDVAVLLNDNARRVSGRVRQNVTSLVRTDNLFYTHTADEAFRALQDVIKRRIPTLFCGGGDGTLVLLISQMKRILESLNRTASSPYLPPKLGLLKLGTGNGWAGSIGQRRGLTPLRDFVVRTREKLTGFNLIDGEDRCFHFAGMGYDAAILNDYILFKEKLGKGLAKHWMGSLGGYLTSMALKTVPQQLLRIDRPNVSIYTEGPVYEISTRSSCRRADPPAGLLYQGPCNLTGVSTVQEYGFGLRAFPFARAMDGYMNLRIFGAGVMEMLANCGTIWRGAWASRRLSDYLVKKVRYVFDRPIPFQIGGDPLGERTDVTFSISDFRVDVLTRA